MRTTNMHGESVLKQDNDSASLHTSVEVSPSEGIQGTPIPYQLRSDWMVTLVLFIGFILVSCVLSQGKKYLFVQLKNFSSTKDRASLFDDATSTDARQTLVFVLQTCLLSGFCLYDYFSGVNPVLLGSVSHAFLLLLFVGYVVFFLFAKYFSYQLINWIFFDKTKMKIWSDAFINIIIGMGFLLFPIVLFIIYFDLSSQYSPYFSIIVLIIAKILLFYKCANTFYHKVSSIFNLILYFCTLEIIPDLVLWKGIELANIFLVLKS